MSIRQNAWGTVRVLEDWANHQAWRYLNALDILHFRAEIPLPCKVKFCRSRIAYGCPLLGTLLVVGNWCLSARKCTLDLGGLGHAQVNLDTYGNAERGWMSHDMYLPHEVLGYMWRFSRKLFHYTFGSLDDAGFLRSCACLAVTCSFCQPLQ